VRLDALEAVDDEVVVADGVARGGGAAAVQRGDLLFRPARELDARAEGGGVAGGPAQVLPRPAAARRVAWCLERQIPVIKAFPLMLLRGTELERSRAQWDLQESDELIPMVVSSRTFSSEEHAAMGRIAEALVETEGAHPRSIEELCGGWAGPLARMRWTPIAQHPSAG
jgi:hypothetical protein